MSFPASAASNESMISSNQASTSNSSPVSASTSGPKAATTSFTSSDMSASMSTSTYTKASAGIRSLRSAPAPRPLNAKAAAPIARTTAPTPANTSQPGREEALGSSLVDAPTTGASSCEHDGHTVASFGISALQFGQFNVSPHAFGVVSVSSGLHWSQVPRPLDTGDCIGLLFLQGLLCEESRRQRIELVPVLGEQFDRLFVGLVEDTPDL